MISWSIGIFLALAIIAVCVDALFEITEQE